MKENIFVFDVESTSLHGTGFAVGAVVIDKKGFIIDTFELLSFAEAAKSNEWVKQNVLPNLKDILKCDKVIDLRNCFFEFYKKHKDTADIWSDCCFPVETNFLTACLNDNPFNREFLMPYPLKDISTFIDVNIDRNELSGLKTLKKHNPLHDAIASGTCLFDYLQKNK